MRRLNDWIVNQNQPLKVISLTREPIGCNISSFFQNFEYFTGMQFRKANNSIAELKQIFLEKYWHEVPMEWFDENLLKNFGIDVYSREFPENGICRYRKNNIEVLLMRLEVADADKVTALKEFLQMEDFDLRNINLGREKEYSRCYQEFKRIVTFPFSYLDRMYGSRYFRHFYDEATRDSLTARWADRIPEAA
ncbi:MAG: putative capsular polysaccharide synthesis family protein [Planctomycetes bacterium]|nr:putative capsular polysaccharide synthesis family protein [Planctomycetota bacterium]